jgi:hypothetical protein
MNRITRRWRSLRNAVARRLILAAVITTGTYIIAPLTGAHPGVVGSLAYAGGYSVSSASGAASRARTRKNAGTRARLCAKPDTGASPADPSEVQILVDQGRMIQAIKRYRELHPGTGLKEAKDIIDGIAARNGAANPEGTL